MLVTWRILNLNMRNKSGPCSADPRKNKFLRKCYLINNKNMENTLKS